MWDAPNSNSIPGYFWYSYRLPDVREYRIAFEGALLALGLPANWRGEGDVTPSDAALEMVIAAESGRRGLIVPVGSIIFMAVTATPPDYLPCTGGLYAKDDYPELFTAIGYTFGGSGDNFAVPNLSGCFPVAVPGAGLSPFGVVGDTGGEQAHTLTTDEMPSHNHGIHSHLPLLVVVPGEGPTVEYSPFGGTTDNTGGGQSHNNLPPYFALTAFISAR